MGQRAGGVAGHLDQGGTGKQLGIAVNGFHFNLS